MADIAGANGLREDFRVVGKPNLPGKSSYALASGIAKFGIDYVLPNMLHAKFLRSPYANARVLSVDTTKASALLGVVDIVTWEDEDIKNLIVGGKAPGVHRRWLDDYADQEGAEVAVIVVAENEDICEEALRLLEVEWEVLPHIVDIQKGRDPEHPVIRPEDRSYSYTHYAKRIDLPKKGNIAYAELAQGDIEEGFKQASHIIEYELVLPAFSSHLPNPPASVAWWTNDPYKGEGKTLHLEGAVQRREEVAAIHGVPADRCIQEGIFQGGKYCDWGMRKSQEITPLLAKRTGRPVRCANKREETFDFLMNQRFMYLKVGFTDEGLMTAIDDFSVSDAGTEGSSFFGTSADQGYGPYYTFKCLNIRQRMDVIDSNRGKMYLSGQHCPFNWDSGTMAIYLIAEKLGKDPVDIARLNLHGPDSQEDMRPVPSFEACVEAGQKLMDWNWHSSGTETLALRLILERLCDGLLRRADILHTVHAHPLNVGRHFERRKQLTHLDGHAGFCHIAAIGAGLRRLPGQCGGRHLPARHAVNGVVDENNRDVFAARGALHGFRRADGRQVAVALIGEDDVFRQRALDAGCNGGRAPVRRLNHITVEVVIRKHGAAHRGHPNCFAGEVEILKSLCHQTVHDAVGAAGAIMQRRIGEGFWFFKHCSHIC